MNRREFFCTWKYAPIDSWTSKSLFLMLSYCKSVLIEWMNRSILFLKLSMFKFTLANHSAVPRTPCFFKVPWYWCLNHWSFPGHYVAWRLAECSRWKFKKIIKTVVINVLKVPVHTRREKTKFPVSTTIPK